jgi:hypothetical protein
MAEVQQVTVGGQDTSTIWTNRILWNSAHVGFKYRKELWEAPCRVAKQMRPFAVAHIRAADGKFASRVATKKGSKDHWSDQVEKFGPMMNSLVARRKHAGLVKRPITLVFVTDTSTDVLWHKVISTSPAWKQFLLKKDGSLEPKIPLLTTIISSHGAEATGGKQMGVRGKKEWFGAGTPPFGNNTLFKEAVHDMANVLKSMAEPNNEDISWGALVTLAAMVFDIMLAALADVFSGNAESSFTLHIEVTRKLKAAIGLDPMAFGGC